MSANLAEMEEAVVGVDSLWWLAVLLLDLERPLSSLIGS